MVIGLMMVTSCESDDEASDLASDIAAPTNLDLIFNITQDNSGLVTISPSGENVSLFEVFYADGTEESDSLDLGENTQRNYAEGTFPVRVVATNLGGLTAEATRDLVVSFRAPENLVVSVDDSVGTNFDVNVSATASFAAFYEVTFGEDATADPIVFMEDETVDYTYGTEGTYDITVTAYSGGAATSVVTEMVIIENPPEPVLLPLDFESSTIDYGLINFESAVSIIDNPDISPINSSSRVVSIEKVGTQTFGGVVAPLTDLIDFNDGTTFRIKTWSPMPVGTKVTMKIENADGSIASADYDTFTTVQGQWETLFFDTTGLDTTQPFSRFVVFFDLGEAPTGDVNYFDDIQQSEGPPVVLPLDFEDDRRVYDIGTNNGSFTIVPNPVSGGINTSSTVMQFDRPATGSNNFSLVAIVVDEPLDFSGSPEFKLKVYSPRAGLPVWFKAERVGNNGLFQEDTSVVTTVANGWEELTFTNFSGNATDDLRNIVIFFDPLGTTAASEVIYIDDIAQTN